MNINIIFYIILVLILCNEYTDTCIQEKEVSAFGWLTIIKCYKYTQQLVVENCYDNLALSSVHQQNG